MTESLESDILHVLIGSASDELHDLLEANLTVALARNRIPGYLAKRVACELVANEGIHKLSDSSG